VNPFDPTHPRVWGGAWCDIRYDPPNGGPINGYGYADAQFSTHLFCSTWASLVTQYLTTSSTYSAVFVSSEDESLVQLINRRGPEFLGVDGRLWPTSYWASPTTWLNALPYKTASRVPVGGPDVRYWNRNRFDDIVNPSGKAILFERFDFSRSSRPSRAGGREKFNPTFNNPEASTRLALGDGGVLTWKLADLYAKISPLTSNPTTINMYTPAGDFEIPDMILGDPDLPGGGPGVAIGKDGLENGDGSMLGIAGGFWKFKGFFFATRNGIQGRDIPH
jgi:hypothetical protein